MATEELELLASSLLVGVGIEPRLKNLGTLLLLVFVEVLDVLVAGGSGFSWSMLIRVHSSSVRWLVLDSLVDAAERHSLQLGKYQVLDSLELLVSSCSISIVSICGM